MNILQIAFSTFVFVFLQLLPSAGKSFRIVGGHDASTLEYPFVVRLEKFNIHWCGGSIIHEKYVLTAAHCVFYYKYLKRILPPMLRIRAGSDKTLTGGQLYNVQKVYPHENYVDKSKVIQYDIALVKITRPFLFGRRVALITLAEFPPREGDMSTVLGYGTEKVRRSGEQTHLKAIKIPISNFDDCKRKLKYVANDMICAGNKKGHEDSCQGDSGGPLIVDNELAGIVAWGIGCGRAGFPGVYTNIALYRGWIENGIK